MIACIGIDPGDISQGKWGISLVGKNGLAVDFLWCSSSAVISGTTVERAFLTLAHERAIELGYHETVVVIEDQYIGKDKRSSLKLAQAAGRWSMMADLLELEWSYVLPRAWQSILQVHGRKQTKTASRGFILDQFGERLNEHTADAACMAIWRLTNGLD